MVYVKPGQDFIGKGHYRKVKSRSHHDVAHLHPQPTSLPSIKFLQFMVSEILTRQHFKGQSSYCSAIQNTLNAIVFKLQVILLTMEVTEKPKSSYYSLSY